MAVNHKGMIFRDGENKQSMKEMSFPLLKIYNLPLLQWASCQLFGYLFYM